MNIIMCLNISQTVWYDEQICETHHNILSEKHKYSENYGVK